MLLAIFLTLFCVALVHWFGALCYHYDGMPIPLSAAMPIFGASLKALCNLRRLHRVGLRESTKHGLFSRGFLLATPVVGVACPRVLRQVLVDADHWQKFDRNHLELEAFDDFLGGGLIMARNGAAWQYSRKLVGGAFRHRRLVGYLSLFRQRAVLLCSRLSKLIDRASSSVVSVDLQPLLQATAFDTIAVVALGVDLNTLDGDTGFGSAWSTILNHLTLRFFLPLPYWLWQLVAPPSYRRALRFLDNAVYGYIARAKRLLMTQGSSVDSGDDEQDEPMRASILYEVLGEQRRQVTHAAAASGDITPLSDREVRNQILTMLFAGHETSSFSMAVTLAFIAREPGLDARVYAEICDVCGSAEPPSDAHIAKLDLLRRCFLEALRLYPPAPLRGRTVTEDVKLSGTAYKCRRNTHVAISPYTIHRHPQLWGADADRFDPDRHLPERFGVERANTMLPFGLGKRRCIGEQFATREVLAVIVTLLQRFRFELPPDYEIDEQFALTLCLANGLVVSMSTRGSTN
jgi:beta-ring hydroxylase